MPDEVAVDEHAVEAVLGADDHLLEQDRGVGARRVGAQPRLEMRVAVDAERGARTGAGGWLGDEGIAELGRGSSRRIRRGRADDVERTGTPFASNTFFIRALSRKLCATSAPMPAMPSASRTSPSGTWSCSSIPSSASTPPRWRESARVASAICCGIGAVRDPVVPGEQRAELVGEPILRVLADQAEANAGKSRRGSDEAHGRGEQERSDEDRVRHLTSGV